MGNFGANFAEKQLVKNSRFCRNFSGQILLEINHTSVFNVFLAEVIIVLLFQQQYAPEMSQWQSLNNIMASAQFSAT